MTTEAKKKLKDFIDSYVVDDGGLTVYVPLRDLSDFCEFMDIQCAEYPISNCQLYFYQLCIYHFEDVLKYIGLTDAEISEMFKKENSK